MSYYIRYVLTTSEAISLPELEKALQEVNASYCIDGDILLLDDEEFGQIDIRSRGDRIFASDLRQLQQFASEKQNRASLLPILQQAESIVTVQPIWSREDEETLAVIEPLFDWLLANRRGLLAIEGGSFFTSSGPLP